jgi:hypothetical protein
VLPEGKWLYSLDRPTKEASIADSICSGGAPTLPLLTRGPPMLSANSLIHK